MVSRFGVSVALAALALPVAAARAEPAFSAIYQSSVSSGACTETGCTFTLQGLPAGQYLRVDHFSCNMSADPRKKIMNLRVSWGAGIVANSIYQRPELMGGDGVSNYWYVRGNPGFVIPAGATPKVSYYAPGAGTSYATCAISGQLIPVTP